MSHQISAFDRNAGIERHLHGAGRLQRLFSPVFQRQGGVSTKKPLFRLVRSFALVAFATTAPMLMSGHASAAVLVIYPFDNNADGNNGFNYTTFNSSVLASSVLSEGPGMGIFVVNTDGLLPNVQVLKTGPGTAISGATSAAALVNDWYFQIALTPDLSMDIDSIEADWTRGGTSGVRGWFVRSSLDNYASNLYSNETPNGTSKGLQHASFDITGFTGLTNRVDFRFYIYTDTTGRYMDFQNIQFNSDSTSAVPEPASCFSLLLFLSSSLVIRRRCR
jgi:hypothetical protein